MVPVGLRLLCGGGACNGQPLLFQLLQQSGIFGGGQFVDQSTSDSEMSV